MCIIAKYVAMCVHINAQAHDFSATCSVHRYVPTTSYIRTYVCIMEYTCVTIYTCNDA